RPPHGSDLAPPSDERLQGRRPAVQGVPAGRGQRRRRGPLSERGRSHRSHSRTRQVPGPIEIKELHRMTSLSESKLREHVRRLEQAQEAFAKHYPGEQGTRQPVHTVYGGAHLFKSDTTRKLG